MYEYFNMESSNFFIKSDSLKIEILKDQSLRFFTLIMFKSSVLELNTFYFY